MKPVAKKLLSASIVAALVVPAAAHATNGYFLPGYGAKSIGMGGVGVAYAQDSIAAAANPAGIADVGMRADLGFGIFNPERSAAIGRDAGSTAAFNGFSQSDNRFYLMPSAGYTMPWSEQLTFGIALVGNGGMNTTYKPNFFALGSTGSKTLGVDLMQMLVPITAAYKVDDHNAFGASLVLGAQRFSARGLQTFGLFGISSDPANLTNRGHDYAGGAGLRLGWRGKIMEDRVTLGATYASKVYMTKFKKYRGLFAEDGSFDVPANYALGIALKATPATTIAFDIERILYSDVPAVHNRGPSSTIPVSTDPSTLLGLSNGMGFGWTNQTVYKLGVDYKYNEAWTLRAGYNYGKSPIPNDQVTFNTLAPATVEKHYTFGFTYSPNKSSELTLAYLHAASNTQSSCGLFLVNCARIKMHQNDIELAYSWKF